MVRKGSRALMALNERPRCFTQLCVWAHKDLEGVTECGNRKKCMVMDGCCGNKGFGCQLLKYLLFLRLLQPKYI